MGGFDCGGADKTKAKQGGERTASVGQVSAESGSDYNDTNGKKSFPEKLYQSLAPPPVAVESAITAEDPVKLKLGDSDSDSDVGALHLQEIKTTEPLLSPPKGTQKRTAPLMPLPSQQQPESLEQSCCYNPNSENDWNTRYQQISLLPKSTAREKLRRAVGLKRLYDEFDESAVRIAKELVAENGSFTKRYPPVSTSGVAGGQSKQPWTRVRTSFLTVIFCVCVCVIVK